MAESKPIKVCLTNKGEDTETPWAHDLGPAPNGSLAGSRLVRLVNVPFMHAKPTWGDAIIVSPAGGDRPLTWDRAGTPWKQISTRIVEDGGRWAMIVDYAPHKGTDGTKAFAELTAACQGQHVVCEGAWDPRNGEPGRAFFAVPKELSAEKLMDILRAARLPLDLIQIHPEPKKRETAPVSTGPAGTKKVKTGSVPVQKLATETSITVEAPTTRASKTTAKASPVPKPPAKPSNTSAAKPAPPNAKAPAKPAAKAAPAVKAAAKIAKAAKAAPAAKAGSKTASAKPLVKAAGRKPAKTTPSTKKPAKKK
ncbi:MAG: hypothetical protein SFX73_27985 [Kofleriaceae bacterium]|nr:hypothetical protein [Kofleriaceae bacterium]